MVELLARVGLEQFLEVPVDGAPGVDLLACVLHVGDGLSAAGDDSERLKFSFQSFKLWAFESIGICPTSIMHQL